MKTDERPAVRFFWTTGGSEDGDHEYHWMEDCMWLLVETARGAKLQVGAVPPDNAYDSAETLVYLVRTKSPNWRFESPVRTSPPADRKRWLCRVCGLYEPVPKAAAREPGEKRCFKCGCPQHFHTSPFRYLFANGCSMAFSEVYPRGASADDFLQVALLHCRCDGLLVRRTDGIAAC